MRANTTVIATETIIEGFGGLRIEQVPVGGITEGDSGLG